VEHQGVPAVVAESRGEVAVLLDPRAAVQQQRRRLRRAAPGEVQDAEQPVPVAVERHAGDTLMPARCHRRTDPAGQ
jgi:hypothetical protein